MTFEEEFPSLRFYTKIKQNIQRFNGKSIPEAKIYLSDADMELEYNQRRNLNKIEVEDVICVPIKDMEKHCLDKQRVKEAIEKCTQDVEPLGNAINPEELKKELGL